VVLHRDQVERDVVEAGLTCRHGPSLLFGRGLTGTPRSPGYPPSTSSSCRPLGSLRVRETVSMFHVWTTLRSRKAEGPDET
jgi:hypothetical protein